MTDDEILTIREVAALLKIGEKTAYNMAKSGGLPGFKVGGQWRFRRSDLDGWIHRQVQRDKLGHDLASTSSDDHPGKDG